MTAPVWAAAGIIGAAAVGGFFAWLGSRKKQPADAVHLVADAAAIVSGAAEKLLQPLQDECARLNTAKVALESKVGLLTEQMAAMERRHQIQVGQLAEEHHACQRRLAALEQALLRGMKPEE